MRRLKTAVALGFLSAFLFILVYPKFGVVKGNPAGESLVPPTGVEASDAQYANKVGIHWNAIRGATIYRIFRNSVNDPGSATDVGTTAANYFFDTTGDAGQAYFYWVRAEDGQGVSSLGTSDQGTRAVAKIIQNPFPQLQPPVSPAGNQMTAPKAYLGKALFWDEQLSSTKTVACGTCHRPAEGGSDPRSVFADARSRNPGFDGVFDTGDDIVGSMGVPGNNANGSYVPTAYYGYAEQVTNRKSPSYLNSGYSPNGLFWDGRASNVFRDPLTNAIVLNAQAGLESQVIGPPTSAVEMAHGSRNWNEVAARVRQSKPLALASDIPAGLKEWLSSRTYPELFQEAFGTADVTPSRIAMAIAAHERTLFSDRSPLDRDQANIEPLTPLEASGRDLFIELRCNFCHGGSLLSDNRFHNIGVRPVAEDLGRAAITGLAGDNAAFRTPTLRNVELHAPYMHNGQFATLEEVVEFYNRGGDHSAPNIDRNQIRPLGLTSENKAELVAFMKRPLTDPRVRDELPPFDRPHLYTESNRVPTVSGIGRAGSGSNVPNAIAIEPPLLGNPSFTVAVSRALGAAEATVVIDAADPGVGTTVPQTGAFGRVATVTSGTGAGNGYASATFTIPNDLSLVGRTFYGRWYIADASAANGIAVSRLFSFTVFAGATGGVRRTHADFDGDSKTDLSVFRPSNGVWYVINSSTGAATIVNFGFGTDRPVPADYDGDGKTDIAVYRDGIWYVMRSRDGFYAASFGLAGDVPQPKDFDGDGKADIAVYRPSNGGWYVLESGGGFQGVTFGISTDVPVAADYDGDGKADIAVFRSGLWYILGTVTGVRVAQFGVADDKPVVGDYDSDGKSDIAVWRPSSGVWYYINSANSSVGAAQFGQSSDVPSPGDYDGDGKSDLAVFRGGAWYVLRSSSGSFFAENWGSPGDKSIPASFVP